MSVAATSAVVFSHYRGYDLPSLPGGVWYSTAQVVGDASAGLRILDIVLNPSSAPRDSRLYSVEDIAVDDADGDAKGGGFNVVNLSVVATPLVNRLYAAPLVVTAQNAMLDPAVAGVLPLFAGSQRVAGVTTEFQFVYANVDLAVLSVTIGGYFWLVRSINAPGGPRRPPFGLFAS